MNRSALIAIAIITIMVIAFFTNFSGFLIGLGIIGVVVGIPAAFIFTSAVIETIKDMRDRRAMR